MITREFSRDFLREELELPYNALEERIIANTGWSNIYEIVFEYEGKFYMTNYFCSATGMQDEISWNYLKTVKCTEVEIKDVVVKQWVPVGVKKDI